jgi:Rad3-related DNA helicase
MKTKATAAKLQFKMLYGSTISDTLFNHSDKIIHMSATVGTKDEYCRNLGIDEADAVYIDCPSPFPVKIRPCVYLRGVGKMNFKEKDTTLPKQLKIIEKICDKFNNDSGIIHTGNYANAEYILTHCSDELRDRLMMPRGENRDKQIDEFFEHEECNGNKILLSPSLREGISLNNAKFGIIQKVPFPAMFDPFMKRRMEAPDGKKYYNNLAILSIIQSCGRIVREISDVVKYNYILDDSFDYFYKLNRRYFPKYFNDAVIVKDI